MKKNKETLHGFKIIIGIMLLAAASLSFAPGICRAGQAEPGEVLAVLRNGIGNITAASLEYSSREGYVNSVAASAGARVAATFDALSEGAGEIFVHIRSETKDTDTLIADLENNPDVICVSPNYVRRASLKPTDPMYTYGRQWGLHRIGAESLWDRTTGGKNLYVAVMDSGIDRTHSDLKDNIDTVRSRNFVNTSGPSGDDNYDDGEGHGSHVSGIIGAVTNNGTGIAGLAWDVNIIALRMLNDEGRGNMASELGAINYLVGLLDKNPDMNLPAVNMSFGGWDMESPEEALKSTLWRAYKELDKRNRTLMVVAAGNDALEVGAPAMDDVVEKGEIVVPQNSYCYPASYTGLDNMIVVGSIEADDTASSFTNWSSKYVDIAAPGGDILSTISDDSYDSWNGTSMAAPHVAGAVALVASDRPDWTASQIKNHILSNTQKSTNPLSPSKVLPRNVPDTTVSRRGLLNLRNLLAVETESSRSGCATGAAGAAATIIASALALAFAGKRSKKARKPA